MSSIYCPHCGFKNLYDLNRPKFCGNCGESFFAKDGQPKNDKKTIKTVKKRPLHKEEENDEDYASDVDRVPFINSLAYEVSYEKNTMTGKDIIGDLGEIKEETSKPKRRGRPKTKTKRAKEKTDLRRKH